MRIQRENIHPGTVMGWWLWLFVQVYKC